MLFTFQGKLYYLLFLLTMHILFRSQIIRSTSMLQWFLSVFLSFLYNSFWLLFLSCELMLFFCCCFLFPENRRRSVFLNLITNVSLSIDVTKSAKSFPDVFLGLLQTLCDICSVFRHFTSNFLLALQ